MPELAGTARDSRAGSDYREADGICAVLDGLRPGITVALLFGTESTGDSAHLEGRQVVFSDGNGSLALSTNHVLPNVTLSPGVLYRVWLEGNYVRVSPAG